MPNVQDDYNERKENNDQRGLIQRVARDTITSAPSPIQANIEMPLKRKTMKNNIQIYVRYICCASKKELDPMATPLEQSPNTCTTLFEMLYIQIQWIQLLVKIYRLFSLNSHNQCLRYTQLPTPSFVTSTRFIQSRRIKVKLI